MPTLFLACFLIDHPNVLLCLLSCRDNIGFPIVEFDGSCDQFLLTKPPNTGGLVTVAMAAEQVRGEGVTDHHRH